MRQDHPMTLETSRLVLRRWRPEDRAPFAALNAEPEVMEHFPARLTRAESDSFVDRIETGFAEHGFGLWALEVRDTGPMNGQFIGFTGLSVPSFQAHFTPAVGVGWRLGRPAWGHGYASRAPPPARGYAHPPGAPPPGPDRGVHHLRPGRGGLVHHRGQRPVPGRHGPHR